MNSEKNLCTIMITMQIYKQSYKRARTTSNRKYKKNSDIINGTTNKISNSIRRNPKSHNRVGINYLICRTMLTDVFTVNENVCNCASGCCDVFGYGCTCACNNS